MKPLAALITIEQLEKLATRSDFRYGQRVFKHADILFTDSNIFNIVAEVKSSNGEFETIEIHSTTKGLRWKCSCTARKGLFCKHGVAVGFFVHQKPELEQADF
jgi:uncharacterized Zn finger protein